jgi:hypothetical protein
MIKRMILDYCIIFVEMSRRRFFSGKKTKLLMQ